MGRENSVYRQPGARVDEHSHHDTKNGIPSKYKGEPMGGSREKVKGEKKGG